MKKEKQKATVIFILLTQLFFNNIINIFLKLMITAFSRVIIIRFSYIYTSMHECSALRWKITLNNCVHGSSFRKPVQTNIKKLIIILS